MIFIKIQVLQHKNQFLFLFYKLKKMVGFYLEFLRVFSPKLMVILVKLCDRRSFYDHSKNMWSTITHDHDCWNWVKKYLWSLMIVIWSEMIGDHDPISPTLILVMNPTLKPKPGVLFLSKTQDIYWRTIFKNSNSMWNAQTVTQKLDWVFLFRL